MLTKLIKFLLELLKSGKSVKDFDIKNDIFSNILIINKIECKQSRHLLGVTLHFFRYL